MVTMPAINKPQLVDEIIATITQQIMEGELKRGQKLPSEIELARQFSVGRNSVREAFRVLRALGIVEIRQGDGTYIASEVSEVCLNPLIAALMMQTGTPMALIELRHLLELGVIELVVHRADEEDLERIAATIDAFQEAVESGADPQELLAEDLQFHYALFEATKNPMLATIGKTIMQLFAVSIRAHLAESFGARNAVENHRRVFAAINARDLQECKKQVLRSFEVWQTYVRVPD
jgi:GntR family transcriptional repressor for pyruvate dehydrogenase complex